MSLPFHETKGPPLSLIVYEKNGAQMPQIRASSLAHANVGYLGAAQRAKEKAA
jgi:hypothetical protein